MSKIENIPLSKLSISPLNVRRTDTDADIEALAASIKAHGLLQNLTVLATDTGRFKVSAGGRRLRALKLLAKNGDLPKDWPVPCRIGNAENAIEQSLAENIHRVAMNAMDEVEAFEKLVAEGQTPEVIAERFGAPLRHVEQRLALAALSPKIRTAYRKGDVTLDVARAFCIAADWETQERVFKQLSKPITHTPSVRNVLTQGRMAAGDRVARFVGLAAYEAAGGRAARDLFDDDQVFLDDGDLVHRLANEKLEALQHDIVAEGWGWAEVQTGFMQIEGCASERLAPVLQKPNAKQAKAIAALETEIEDLNNLLEADESNDALWDRREAAELELSILQDGLRTWDSRHMALAGASVGIDRDGAAIITRGLIKRSDLKALGKLRQAGDAPGAVDDDNDDTPPPTSGGAALPRDLTEKLTAIRTCGLRAEIAAAPQAALALLVFSLVQQHGSKDALPGLGIRATSSAFADHKSFKGALPAMQRGAPISLEHAFTLPTETLVGMLAVLVAETLNLAQRGAGAHDAALQASADAIAALVELDMSKIWRADAEFWRAAPKALALEALMSAPKYAGMTERVRTAAFAKLAKLRKAELADIAEAELAALGWLPDVLVTPPREGAFARTDEGQKALSAA